MSGRITEAEADRLQLRLEQAKAAFRSAFDRAERFEAALWRLEAATHPTVEIGAVRKIILEALEGEAPSAYFWRDEAEHPTRQMARLRPGPEAPTRELPHR